MESTIKRCLEELVAYKMDDLDEEELIHDALEEAIDWEEVEMNFRSTIEDAIYSKEADWTQLAVEIAIELAKQAPF